MTLKSAKKLAKQRAVEAMAQRPGYMIAIILLPREPLQMLGSLTQITRSLLENWVKIF